MPRIRRDTVATEITGGRNRHDQAGRPCGRLDVSASFLGGRTPWAAVAPGGCGRTSGSSWDRGAGRGVRWLIFLPIQFTILGVLPGDLSEGGVVASRNSERASCGRIARYSGWMSPSSRSLASTARRSTCRLQGEARTNSGPLGTALTYGVPPRGTHTVGAVRDLLASVKQGPAGRLPDDPRRLAPSRSPE